MQYELIFGKNEDKKFYPYTFAFFPKAPIV